MNLWMDDAWLVRVSEKWKKWLGERLHDLFDLVKSTGKIERTFVWGSFVSSKESPNDTDYNIDGNMGINWEGRKSMRFGPIFVTKKELEEVEKLRKEKSSSLDIDSGASAFFKMKWPKWLKKSGNNLTVLNPL